MKGVFRLNHFIILSVKPLRIRIRLVPFLREREEKAFRKIYNPHQILQLLKIGDAHLRTSPLNTYTHVYVAHVNGLALMVYQDSEGISALFCPEIFWST